MTTAEVWDIWLEHPELVSAVDYLAVHILPYWEGLPCSAAVDHAMKIYQRLRQAYPGKRIVIAEFGWPSAGLNRLAGRAGSVGSGRDHASTSSPAPTPWASTIRSSRPSISRGRRSKAASAPIGACSIPSGTEIRAERAGRDAELALEASSPRSPRTSPLHPDLRHARHRPARPACSPATAHAIGAWGSNVFDYWARHYFVLGSLHRHDHRRRSARAARR